MKRKLLVALLALATAGCFALGFTACSFFESSALTYDLNSDNTGYIVYSDSCTGNVKIPNKHNDLPVTEIGVIGFKECTGLTSIIIPDSVTSIGNSAFYGCSNLTSVTIGNGITSISACAFQYCSSLKSINIPDGVTSIDNAAFSGCTNLVSITIGSNVNSIGGLAFFSCTNLKNVYYKGNEKDWAKIDIGIVNENLTNATIHYNS